MDSLLLRRRLFQLIADDHLPYNVSDTPLTLDPQLHEYFLDRIYEITGRDLRQSIYFLVQAHDGKWYNYSTYTDTPSYWFFVYDGDTIPFSSTTWFEDGTASSTLDYNSFQIKKDAMYLSIGCAYFCKFEAREIGPYNENGYSFYDDALNSFMLGDLPYTEHISNELFTFDASNHYPVYASHDIYVVDRNNTRGLLFISNAT